MELVSSEENKGNYYHDEESGCSVFEKKQGEESRFCAWDGAVEDYAAASRTPWANSNEEAVEFLKFQQFRCEKCGRIRVRFDKKKWTDECKEGGGHDWAPTPGKKKQQPGRKINIWFSDNQLLEVEKVSDETGNDRASTIRELLSLGLKSRRQMDKSADNA
jgi:hypothetical protein